MKNKQSYVYLAVAVWGSILENGIAHAQSVITNTIPAQNVVAETPKPTSDIKITYLGLLNGPGFSGELNGKTKDGDDLYLHNRPTFKYRFNDNILLGVQPRFNVRFLNGSTDAVLDNWRLQGEFKNIFKSSVLAFSATPRISLPMRMKSHDQTMTPSPELFMKLDYTPQNSRFQFDTWYLLGDYFYKDKAKSLSAISVDSVLALEATYQLGGTTSLTFGYYAEHASTNQAAITSVSNELDLGVNWDFAKGWSVNPVVATEFNGIGANNAPISKNMGLYVWVSGAVL